MSWVSVDNNDNNSTSAAHRSNELSLHSPDSSGDMTFNSARSSLGSQATNSSLGGPKTVTIDTVSEDNADESISEGENLEGAIHIDDAMGWQRTVMLPCQRRR